MAAERDQLRQFVNTLTGSLPSGFLLASALCLMLVLYAFCALLPNSAQLLNLDHPWPAARGFLPEKAIFLRWHPTVIWGSVIGFAFGMAMLISRQVPQEFLYWRF
jgi:hypothetical protein